jgi:hypothetical protein
LLDISTTPRYVPLTIAMPKFDVLELGVSFSLNSMQLYLTIKGDENDAFLFVDEVLLLPSSFESSYMGTSFRTNQEWINKKEIS